MTEAKTPHPQAQETARAALTALERLEREAWSSEPSVKADVDIRADVDTIRAALSTTPAEPVGASAQQAEPYDCGYPGCGCEAGRCAAQEANDRHAAQQAEQASDAQDAARLDWLSRQCVTVRIPLRYGSRECFSGSPDIEDPSWDLRAAIDAAITKDQA